MLLQPEPLYFSELHAFPIIVTRGILLAELDAPRFFRRALCRGNVGLKLNCIGASVRDRIDVGMRYSHTAIVRLRDLPDDQRLPSSVWGAHIIRCAEFAH